LIALLFLHRPEYVHLNTWQCFADDHFTVLLCLADCFVRCLFCHSIAPFVLKPPKIRSSEHWGNVLPMATSPQESDFAPLGLAISRPVKIFRSSVENG